MSLLGEIRNLVKNIGTISDGQVTIREIGDDMSQIKIEIRPRDGLYRGGSFIFQIKMNADRFTTKGPEVYCLTHIYHPNIDTEKGVNYENFGLSNVCLNILKNWQPTYTLIDLINGLLFLFYHPNLDDPYSSYFETKITDENFEKNVRQSLLGKLEIGGIKFDKNSLTGRKRKEQFDVHCCQAKRKLTRNRFPPTDLT